MTYILFGLGVLFILLGFVDVFPKVKQNYLDQEEMQRWQKQKNEVNQAKNDLEILLEELKKVSEQAVKSIEAKINEVKIINSTEISYQKGYNQMGKVSETNADKINIKDQNINKKNEQKDIKENINKKVKKENITKTNPQEDINDVHTDNQKLETNLNTNSTIDKHTYIYQLSKQGVSVEEIAQKVQMGKGEVELIIGIKRRGEQA